MVACPVRHLFYIRAASRCGVVGARVHAGGVGARSSRAGGSSTIRRGEGGTSALRCTTRCVSHFRPFVFLAQPTLGEHLCFVIYFFFMLLCHMQFCSRVCWSSGETNAHDRTSE